MMVTFLNNLPSFDKDNFSNFQPDLNQYAQTKKQHSYIIGTTMDRGAKEGDDDSSPPFSDSSSDQEQLIVNQRCNLIIQYLDKQSRGDHDDDDDDCDEHVTAQHMFTLAAAAEKSRKRDIREVLDTNPESFGGAKSSRDVESSSSSSPSSSKYTKKRRTSIQNTESIASRSSSSPSSAAAAMSTEAIELIEVDNTNNDNVDF